jgi:SAM-dependent methyltransferase
VLYSYGVKLGVRAMLMGHRSVEHVKTIVAPVNYWRSFEYRLVLEALQATATDRILDLGSPELLSLYLADVIGAQIVAMDIVDYFVRRYRTYQKVQHVADRLYHAILADGRALPFGNASFSKIYSISVLEHVPGEGDAECAKEMGRTLKPGGICAMTVPFAPGGAVECRDPGQFYWAPKSGEARPKQIFYQRRYSEKDLHERIMGPSGLIAEKVLYLGERYMSWTRRELCDFLHPMVGPLHPGLSRVFPCSSQSFLEGSREAARSLPGAEKAVNEVRG